jgi:hypothetical protein
MDDRRHLPRKYLIIYSRVFERTMGKLLGYLDDLSLHGAMIISEEKMDVGAVLELRFDLPDPQVFGRNNLYVFARVVRCDPDISPAFFNIGFEFQGMTPEQMTTIEKMMNAYEFKR